MTHEPQTEEKEEVKLSLNEAEIKFALLFSLFPITAISVMHIVFRGVEVFSGKLTLYFLGFMFLFIFNLSAFYFEKKYKINKKHSRKLRSKL